MKYANRFFSDDIIHRVLFCVCVCVCKCNYHEKQGDWSREECAREENYFKDLQRSVVGIWIRKRKVCEGRRTNGGIEGDDKKLPKRVVGFFVH
jgi:hypothetical protein